MAFRTSQFYLHHIVHRSIITLLIAGVAAYLAIGLIFFSMYSYIECSAVMAGANCESWHSIDSVTLFSFSIITQSTLGYGNIVPGNIYGHIIVIAQIVTGVVFSAMYTGLLVVRILIPSPRSLISSDHIVFDPDTGHFSIRIMNILSLTMYDVGVKLLSLRLVESTGIFNRQPLPLMVDRLSYLDTMVPTMLRTVRALPLEGTSVAAEELPDRITPENLFSISSVSGRKYSAIRELRLVISASTPAGNMFVTLRFGRNRLVCGKHIITYDEGTKKYNMGNFNKVELTDQVARCPTCRWVTRCALRETSLSPAEKTEG